MYNISIYVPVEENYSLTPIYIYFTLFSTRHLLLMYTVILFSKICLPFRVCTFDKTTWPNTYNTLMKQTAHMSH